MRFRIPLPHAYSCEFFHKVIHISTLLIFSQIPTKSPKKSPTFSLSIPISKTAPHPLKIKFQHRGKLQNQKIKIPPILHSRNHYPLHHIIHNHMSFFLIIIYLTNTHTLTVPSFTLRSPNLTHSLSQPMLTICLHFIHTFATTILYTLTIDKRKTKHLPKHLPNTLHCSSLNL